MHGSVTSRTLARIAQIQGGEAATACLMFFYSFLAMASYNAIKPITRSKMIDSLGADNLPYMQLIAGILVGLIMVGYSRLMARLPRRWSLPIVQGGIAALLLAFWVMFQVGGTWVSVLFYISGLVLGILLISQFWTLANVVYDPRQAKRLFGFIGAGAPLGGIAGSILTIRLVELIGSANMLLVGAVLMAISVPIIIAIIVRERLSALAVSDQEGSTVKGRQALELLINSRHLQTIALVISCSAIGAAIIEQQLNMAAAAAHDQESAIAGFLAGIQAWTSIIGLLVQVLLTSRVHRFLGIGFALLILPSSLGLTGLVMLMVGALWAPALARVLDQSFRYTIDRTSREILFMPLPSDIKLRAKPFMDVTVDRFAKAFGAVILLVLIKPWGLHLSWVKLSYASLTIMLLWIVAALYARRGYIESFRKSIGNRQIQPEEIRAEVADLSMIEALVAELSNPDDRKVLYAIELLESMGRKNLITPLLLLHDSSAVRLRALSVIDGVPPETAERWLPSITRLLSDNDPEVRARAFGALANIQSVNVLELVRPRLEDSNPRIAIAAAMVLARNGTAEDRAAAETVLQRLRKDPRTTTVQVRKELAALLRQIPDIRFRPLLILLLTDSSIEVAQEALRSVRQVGECDQIFVPVLITLLRHSRLRQDTRDLLVGYGEPGLEVLGHFLQDPNELPSVRRSIPSVIAGISSPKAVNLLMGALSDPDRRVRFAAIGALETMSRKDAGLTFPREPIEALVFSECETHAYYASARRSCFGSRMPYQGQLLGRALQEKEARSIDRLFRLLGFIFPWRDIAAAQWSIERGGLSRARALEYLDNILPGPLRKRVLPTLEGAPSEVGTLNTATGALRSDPIRRLIRDTDPAISAAAIHFVWENRQRQYRTDVESVPTFHDVAWWVSEEAAWVAGAFQVSVDRPLELHVGPLPAVEIAALLDRLPVFGSVSVDELIRLSSAGRHIHHQHGNIIYHDNEIAEDVQFLIEGKTVFTSPSGAKRYVDAPTALSFEEVVEDRPMNTKVSAASPCLCLSFTLAELEALMAESTGLVEGFLRMLCTNMPEAIGTPVIRGTGTQSRLYVTANMNPMAKATLLETLPVFCHLSRGEMLSLTEIASEITVAAGTHVFTEADPPTLHLLASGSVSLESSDEESVAIAGPGDAIGLYQLLAGIPLVRQGRCLEGARLLRIEREDLLELMMQRPELQRQMLASLFRGTHPPRESLACTNQ